MDGDAETAVDVNDLAGDEAASLRSQKADERGDLLGPALADAGPRWLRPDSAAALTRTSGAPGSRTRQSVFVPVLPASLHSGAFSFSIGHIDYCSSSFNTTRYRSSSFSWPTMSTSRIRMFFDLPCTLSHGAPLGAKNTTRWRNPGRRLAVKAPY